MTEQATDPPPSEAAPSRPRPIFWIAVLIVALSVAGGGFFLTRTLLGQEDVAATMEPNGPGPVERPRPMEESPQFLELDPALVAVGGPDSIRQLRFRAFLEVAPKEAERLSALSPRLLDICATYLRALDVDTLEQPSALMRIRAQLLRRIQLMAGPGAITDLLIVDFVIT